MDLQVALLLVGAVVVGLVALTVYDKGRIARSLRRGVHLSPEPSSPPPESPNRREPMMRADTADKPDDTTPESDRKFLKTDAQFPAEPATVTTPTHPLADVLGDFEEVANRPLNLNPGFDPPGTGPEAARSYGIHMEPHDGIDFIIHLPGPGPVSRRSSLSVYKQNEYKLDYPRQLYGRRYQTNFWSVVQHDSDATQYSDLKLAIQLINSRGPISETELNTFVQIGLKLADTLHRLTKLSLPFEQALARARELQQFYDEHDVIAGVYLVSEPSAPFKGRAILAAAERVGMELDARAIFTMRNDDGDALFWLANLSKPGSFPTDWDPFRTSGLALYMSVPVAQEPVAVFDRMIETAKQLTTFLGARLLDQDQRPLTEIGIATIRAQIQGIDAKMRGFGIAPGSEPARRIFVSE